MKPFEEQFTAWVDGKLTGEELAEFEKRLDAHPGAFAERDAARRLARFLHEHPTVPRLTNPDFFNHQLMQRMAADSPPPSAKGHGPMWSLARLAWAGVFCLLMAFGLFKALVSPPAAPIPDSTYFAQVVEAWPLEPGVSATTVYSPEDNVTVVWLDGLDYIPGTYALN